MEDNNNVKNENQGNLKDQNFVPAYKRDNTQETANKATMDKNNAIPQKDNAKIFLIFDILFFIIVLSILLLLQQFLCYISQQY